jgi:release factor glutamine methyltransferase
MLQPSEVFKKIKKILGDSTSPFLEARVRDVLAAAASAVNSESWHLAIDEPGFLEIAMTLARLQALGFPLAYLKGKVNFGELELTVLPGVFIPRQETELLAEFIAATIEAKKLSREFKLLDVGTGTGALALYLARRFKKATVLAIDKNPLAVKNAALNARKLGLFNVRVEEISYEDLIKGFKEPEFDVIVSNPPYIGEFEKLLLPKEVRLVEPEDALFSGFLGLEFYSLLFESLPLVIKKEGLFFFEIGFNQESKIEEIARSYGLEVEFFKDYAGVARGVWGQYHG